jgi:hypothetical protein
VAVGVDEPRHHDEPLGVDDLCRVALEVGTDSNDGVAVDEDIGLGEVAHLGIHRDDTTAGDSDQASCIGRASSRAAIARGFGWVWVC